MQIGKMTRRCWFARLIASLGCIVATPVMASALNQPTDGKYELTGDRQPNADSPEHTTIVEYDALGRITHYSDGPNTTLITVYEYDANTLHK